MKGFIWSMAGPVVLGLVAGLATHSLDIGFWVTIGLVCVVLGNCCILEDGLEDSLDEITKKIDALAKEIDVIKRKTDTIKP